MQAVMKVFAEIAPKLNLAEYPPGENLQPDEAKRYLTSNRLKFCVLVVDANTIRGAYKNQLQQTCKELLETAANEVGKIVGHFRETKKKAQSTRCSSLRAG